MHGGAAPQVKAKAKERLELEAAKDAVANYGLPREIDPHSALMEELWRTAGHISWVGLKIKGMDETETIGPLMVLYQTERDHFVKVAKSCIEAGIAERQVQIAEQQGQLIADLFKAVFEDLGIADDPRIPAVVRRHLSAVA